MNTTRRQERGLKHGACMTTHACTKANIISGRSHTPEFPSVFRVVERAQHKSKPFVVAVEAAYCVGAVATAAATIVVLQMNAVVPTPVAERVRDTHTTAGYRKQGTRGRETKNDVEFRWLRFTDPSTRTGSGREVACASAVGFQLPVGVVVALHVHGGVTRGRPAAIGAFVLEANATPLRRLYLDKQQSTSAR